MSNDKQQDDKMLCNQEDITAPVHRFTKIFTYIKVQMSKLKCQINVKAQSSKCLAPISIFGIW